MKRPDKRINLTQSCREVQMTILQALGLAFDLPEDYFLPYHSACDNQLRLLHYPQYCLPFLDQGSC